MNAKKSTFFILLALVLVLSCISITGLWGIKGVRDIRFGIDIRGGVEAVFQPKDYDGVPTAQELESARTIMEGRLDSMNILDREVTTDKQAGTILIRFPWKSGETEFNPESAIQELGAMAKLTFRDEAGNVLLEGKNVASSRAEIDSQSRQPIVTLDFDSAGAQLFGQATQANVGKLLYIYMDDTEISAAQVNQAIWGGQAYISGKFTTQETQALAEKINAGSLPYSLETKSFSTISPTLASNALRVMVIAGALALGCICLFMILRYRLAGAVSCLALLLQTAVQLLAVSVTQITLTLPGIAGIILSIGMGVDANIIINERIADELHGKNTLRMAVKAGYHNAFLAVLDGNLTTLIVALLLIFFGSGSMLSFGYTLTIGLIMNLAAGVGATRLMLDSLLRFPCFGRPGWFRLGKEPRVHPFYKKRRIYFIVSAVLLSAGLALCFVRGVSLDTQFKGGVVLKYTAQTQVDTEAVEKLAAKAFGVPATAQLADDFSGGGQKLVLTLAQNTGITPEQQSAWNTTLSEAYPDAQLSLNESFAVEPFIGKKAMTNAVIALVLASVMIILYIWIRFRRISGLSAGVMALLALLHDACIVFFVFVAARFPIGDSFVAVALTIIGYSINDTIVIYDRIRENKLLYPRLTTPELADLSISQSFSRSLYTSLTTLASVVFLIGFSLWYGIDSVLYFALPMAFGIVSGCYSTICIAGPLWVSWRLRKDGSAKKTDKKARAEA
ncbi:MAG: protein translocase subunit SecF [Eubacteriales bacterium]|nr:protein translocase subunit SecF [Eubacteriales bacterium]